jgi:formylglycine-generating enzyme required for sulfatase activity/tRNA A-37 threonylcarbamoyl transferase component Bud32
MNLEGQHIGEFEILERIGQGGMGAVYKARQSSLRRNVALKTLQASLADDVEYIARFEQEAVAAASLSHPNLVQVYSAGESDGLNWFAMEYIEGESAKARLKRKGRLDPLEAIAIAIHVATALEYGWRKAALIHRDIKPDNIFLSSDGEVKLGDLGLAKSAGQTQGLTMTGASMGTPHYISPEQVEAMKDVDLRADIYSLGCTLYHLLSGHAPFDGNSAVATMMKHVNAPTPDLRSVWPECPTELAAAVLKMMQKRPAERQQTYEEVNADLRRAYDVFSGSSVPSVVGVTQKAAKAEKKRGVPLSVWVGSSVALLTAVAALIYFAPWEKLASKGITPAGSGAAKDEALPFKATKDAPFVNTLGMKFVPVPGTQALFSIWDTRVQDYAAYAGAKKVDDSWTKQQRDGVPVGRELNHPVVGVSWEDAQGFCQWLTEKETAEGRLPKGLKYRLPTDEEWSWAVGMPPELGTTPAEKSGKNNVDFPWGKDYPPTKKVGNYADETFHGKFPKDVNDKTKDQPWIEGYTDGYATTSPAGSFPANAYGLYDMGGNVWQWCDNWFDASHIERVMRGASWSLNDRGTLLSSIRFRHEPGHRGHYLGFRCVLAPAVSNSSVVATLLLPSNEPWQDMLRDPATLDLRGSAKRTPEGLSFTDFGLAVRSLNLGPKGDGAVRMRATFGGLHPLLVARNSEAGEYQLFAADAKMITLNRWDNIARRVSNLGYFPLREILQPGRDYELELRVVGQALTAKFNGELLGTVTDTVLAEGTFGVGLADRKANQNDTPATVKALEVLDLDAPAVASSTVPAPATASKDAPFINSLGMKFVPVPILGGPTAGHRVLFSVWDTRVQDYEAFVRETKREWPKPAFDQGPSHPALNVSWEDAQVFCQWLTSREQTARRLPAEWRYRLPSDHEWSCAVEIGAKEDATMMPSEKSGKIKDMYPWGAQWPPPAGAGNYAGEELRPALAAGKYPFIKDLIDGYNDGFVNTSPVGSFAGNRFGLFDTAGNVRQWCEDWFDKDQMERVLRGSAWFGGDRFGSLSSGRAHQSSNFRGYDTGFRCVLASTH